MTTAQPDALLSLGRPLLLDGAMATNLQLAGLPSGTPPELWTLAQPARVEAIHRAFLKAGADVVLTNSFGANRHRLAPSGAAGQVGVLNRESARLGRRVAGSAGRPVLVAGSVGPTGAHRGELSEGGARAVFTEQMVALAEGGVEAIWIETMGNAAEARAAAAAAAATGLPFALTASPHAGSGLDAVALATLATSLDPAPFAIGFNCGTGPDDLLASLAALAVAAPGIPLIAKPNAGLPTLRDGTWHYPASLADFARLARKAERIGAQLVGGCCGITPGHIEAMREAMRKQPF